MNISTMKKVLTHPIFSVTVASQLLAAMKPAMVNAGIHDFPVICLIGGSGSGKTSLANQVLRGGGVFHDFVDDKKKIINTLMDNFNRITVLDDYAALSSDTGRRKQNNIIDTATRVAYSKKGGTLLLTMERDTLPRIIPSCRNRMLMVDIGEGVEDDIFRCLLTYLQSSDDLGTFYDGFRKFVQGAKIASPSDVAEYRDRLKDIPGYWSRTASILFCYHRAMELVDEFFLANGYGQLDMSAIEEIERGFFVQHLAQQGSTAEVILHRLLMSGELSVQVCPVTEECSGFAWRGCPERCSECCPSFCRKDEYPDWQLNYSPTDLLIDYDAGYTALLVNEPDFVAHFHRPYPVPPMLLIDAEELTIRMNSTLKGYVHETGSQEIYWTSEKLRKELFDVNRCIYISNGDKGRRYTFLHHKIIEHNVETMRAVAILLRSDEAALLASYANKDFIQRRVRFTFSAYAPDIVREIKTVWPQFCVPAGKVGTPAINQKVSPAAVSL